MHSRPRILGLAATEIDALARAVGQSVGHPHEFPLVSLLRKLAPAHPLLITMDRVSREHGYAAAGTNERLPGWPGDAP